MRPPHDPIRSQLLPGLRSLIGHCPTEHNHRSSNVQHTSSKTQLCTDRLCGNIRGGAPQPGHVCHPSLFTSAWSASSDLLTPHPSPAWADSLHRGQVRAKHWEQRIAKRSNRPSDDPRNMEQLRLEQYILSLVRMLNSAFFRSKRERNAEGRIGKTSATGIGS